MIHPILGAALVTALLALGASRPAAADRVQVYSIRGADCASCGTEIERALRKLRGVKRAVFDRDKVEMTVTLADRVQDRTVLAVIEKEGFEGIVGPGRGAYLPQAPWPDGLDMQVLTRDGSTVGPFEKLRVPGRYTVFDVYADWCGPCRVVDAKLREIAARRKDVAVRRLNVVGFESPLARQLGTRLKALPFLVVFDPRGRSTDLVGADLERIARALGEP